MGTLSALLGTALGFIFAYSYVNCDVPRHQRRVRPAKGRGAVAGAAVADVDGLPAAVLLGKSTVICSGDWQTRRPHGARHRLRITAGRSS
jgi:hypothetical protein